MIPIASQIPGGPYPPPGPDTHAVAVIIVVVVVVCLVLGRLAKMAQKQQRGGRR